MEAFYDDRLTIQSTLDRELANMKGLSREVIKRFSREVIKVLCEYWKYGTSSIEMNGDKLVTRVQYCTL